MTVSPHTSLDLCEPLTPDSAADFVRASALHESAIGPVGLEIETHLVDLDAAGQRVGWDRIASATAAVRAAAGSTPVTFEPGGQLELSGPPAAGIDEAVAAMRHDEQSTRLALAERRLGLAHLGADPLRPPQRVNPRPRYRSMQQHYEATGRQDAGLTMMCSTAALQVNLQAGPAAGWRERVARAHRLGPTLVAIAANSPWLGGRDSGWKSVRQRCWADLAAGDVPDPEADPAEEWNRYALRSPVLFVGSAGDGAVAVLDTVPFADWLTGRVVLGGRRPTLADLQTHLTTLFPPVRLRGYLEIRYLDVAGPRWWPAVSALMTILMDDPVAADAAAEATEPTVGLWTEAARAGLSDPRLAEAARRCVRIAVARVPDRLATAVEDLADLVESGRCPGDLLTERIAECGPQLAFEELARA